MANIEITILKKDENRQEVIEVVETSGFLILFLEDDKIRMKGQMDIKSLAPILTKLALEKLSR